MKKINMALIMLIGLLFLTGCSKTTVCTLNSDQGTYTINSEYKIIYDDDYVSKVETKEEVISDDQDIIDQFEEIINEQLVSYQDLKYYDFKVNKQNGKLTETISIDYTKIDVDKFLEINSAASSMFINKKIKYDTIVSLYEQFGAICE